MRRFITYQTATDEVTSSMERVCYCIRFQGELYRLTDIESVKVERRTAGAGEANVKN